MKTKIIGTGHSVPAFAADNHAMEALVETSDTWIQERTGIKQRYIAITENTVSMAAIAGGKALASAGITADQIDLLIVATVSPDTYFPSTACCVQKELGAVNATAFDINAACSGFMFGVHTADAYIRSGMCKTALVIASETLSKMLDWTDRSSCILFGDGAGAAVVQASETGIIDAITGSDGTKGNALICQNRKVANPYIKAEEGLEANTERKDYLHMDGQEVFKFAVRRVPACISELLKRNHLTPEDITYFVLHQANQRIIDSVAKRLKADKSKFPVNLERYGNTSAASLPILLDEMNEKGMLKPGDKLVLSGFGAGLTWGALLLEW